VAIGSGELSDCGVGEQQGNNRRLPGVTRRVYQPGGPSREPPVKMVVNSDHAPQNYAGSPFARAKAAPLQCGGSNHPLFAICYLLVSISTDLKRERVRRSILAEARFSCAGLALWSR
jgi:hypothetical protein